MAYTSLSMLSRPCTYIVADEKARSIITEESHIHFCQAITTFERHLTETMPITWFAVRMHEVDGKTQLIEIHSNDVSNAAQSIEKATQ